MNIQFSWRHAAPDLKWGGRTNTIVLCSLCKNTTVRESYQNRSIFLFARIMRHNMHARFFRDTVYTYNIIYIYSAKNTRWNIKHKVLNAVHLLFLVLINNNSTEQLRKTCQLHAAHTVSCHPSYSKQHHHIHHDADVDDDIIEPSTHYASHIHCK